LDEVGDLPPAVQVKLLRVLQDGTFSRVGSNEVIHADVRIVTATNKNLAAEVTAGRFREDLYYRLNVVEIQLPPLRERPEDIPILAEFFLDRLAKKQGSARMRLTGEAVEHLKAHLWPGNVRELENTMARACALANTDILLPEDIPIGQGPHGGPSELSDALDTIVGLARESQENALAFAGNQLIEYAISLSGGNLTEAAKVLGLSLEKLRSNLQLHGDD